MKFTAERDLLILSVKRAAGVAQQRTTIPILACVLLRATDTGVHIVGTNMDEWADATCEAAVSMPGATCVHAASLHAWLGAAPKGALVICEIAGNTAKFSAGRSIASFDTLPAEDFPVPTADGDLTEIIGAVDALAVCLPYCSQEDARFYLLGVAISQGHAVATDGHRICAVDIGCDLGISAIIPTAAVRQITACSKSARLFVGDTRWACEDKNLRLGGKLIEGTFPDWKKIMPAAKHTGVVDADALAAAILSVSVVGAERIRPVKMTGDGGSIHLSTKFSGSAAEASLASDGGEFEFGLNSKYAAVALETFSGRVVNFAVDGNTMSLSCDSAPQIKAVLMGMRI